MSEHDDLNELMEKAAKCGLGLKKRRRDTIAVSDCCGSAPCATTEEDDEKKVHESYTQWTSHDKIVFIPAGPTRDRLTPGVYEICASPSIGIYFKKIPVRTEGLLRFPDTNSDRVISEIQRFWEREEYFEEYGLTYKRGIILYGPPGSGKSCTIQLVMQDVVQRGGVVVKFLDPHLFIEGMRILRKIQPECPVVAIMEDVDAILEMYNESEVLNILDGVNEVDKVVFVATTNYPEVLGPRIINRPSRFDKRFRIGFPSAASRRMYFEHLIGEDTIKQCGIDLKQWVEDTDEMSIAHLKELFIAVVILGDEYKEAIETLRSMKEPIENKDFDKPMGFNAGKRHRRDDDEYYA